jgi:hypothetical protein
MMAVLILVSALFVAGMLWIGHNALLVLPLVALFWLVLLWAEVRGVRRVPDLRRDVRRVPDLRRVVAGRRVTADDRPRPPLRGPARTSWQGSR